MISSSIDYCVFGVTVHPPHHVFVFVVDAFVWVSINSAIHLSVNSSHWNIYWIKNFRYPPSTLDDGNTWKCYMHSWPLVKESHWSTVASPQRARDTELWRFLLLARICRTNSRVFDYLRRHDAHMTSLWCAVITTTWQSRLKYGTLLNIPDKLTVQSCPMIILSLSS